jgi:hypothetical protein
VVVKVHISILALPEQRQMAFNCLEQFLVLQRVLRALMLSTSTALMITPLASEDWGAEMIMKSIRKMVALTLNQLVTTILLICGCLACGETVLGLPLRRL